MKKYILIIVTIVLTNISFSQTEWDGKYPWYSADRYGDIRRGISYRSSFNQVFNLYKVKNMNKFRNSVGTLISSDNDIFLNSFFDFENKKVTVINSESRTVEVYDVLKVKNRKVNKEKTDGIFTLVIKKGDTKINYYINTYDKYFCKIIYYKKEKMGVVMFNNISSTGYKTYD